MNNDKPLSDRLQDRFTKEQAELAAKISNDIAEDIDNHESKKDLRMAVDYWASVACDNCMALRMNQDEKIITELKELNKQLNRIVK